MSGQIQYHQKCICGAEISISKTFDFAEWDGMKKQFQEWQAEHRHCVPFFVEVQRARLAQLNQKLIGAG